MHVPDVSDPRQREQVGVEKASTDGFFALASTRQPKSSSSICWSLRSSRSSMARSGANRHSTRSVAASVPRLLPLALTRKSPRPVARRCCLRRGSPDGGARRRVRGRASSRDRSISSRDGVVMDSGVERAEVGAGAVVGAFGVNACRRRSRRWGGRPLAGATLCMSTGMRSMRGQRDQVAPMWP